MPITITTDASAATIVMNNGSTSKKKEEEENGANQKNGSDTAAANDDDAKSSNGKEQEGPTPVASVREVFSFARTRKVRLYIGSSFFFAAVSGCVMPGTFAPRCCFSGWSIGSGRGLIAAPVGTLAVPNPKDGVGSPAA